MKDCMPNSVFWRVLVVLLLCVSLKVHAVDAQKLEATILVQSDEFAITLFDLYMYLQPEQEVDEDGFDWGSSERLREGLQQLYALKVLRARADRAELMSSEERQWKADYELSMALVKQYLSNTVEAEASRLDLEQLALEYYLSHKPEFYVPETLSLRTLLVSIECRSPDEAFARADALTSQISETVDFEHLVRQHTEDPAAVASGGLMSSVIPGQTVPEFEEIAFSLSEPGELSEPVLTEFGVHVIQLISRSPARQQSFEEIKGKLLARLETEEKNKILQTLRMEAREYRPEGLELNMGELEKLVDSAATRM